LERWLWVLEKLGKCMLIRIITPEKIISVVESCSIKLINELFVSAFQKHF
jgi:hypothetical protein